MISPTGYVPSMESGPNSGAIPYVYPSLSPISPYGAAPQFGIPNMEYIPHRIFVGGFASATKEEDLRSFFQQFGSIREVKVIKNPQGFSKGYGFVTFETEEEANKVRNMDPQKLHMRGRRLNLGPAVRRIGIPRYGMAGFEDYGVGANTQYWQPISYAYAYPNSPPFLVVSPNQMVFPAAAAVSPPTSPTAASAMQTSTNGAEMLVGSGEGTIGGVPTGGPIGSF